MVYFDAPIRVFDPHSGPASALSWLMWLIFAIALVVVLGVSFMLIWSSLKFRHRTNSGDDGEPRQVSGNFKIEVAWTAAPAVLLIALFVPTIIAMNDSDPVVAVNSQPSVEIVGHQWWWEYRYFDNTGKVLADTANVMYMPTGNKKFLAKLTSQDVIHDWWVPQIARKMDNNPGQANYEYIQADDAGVYHGFCAEFCGVQHAFMQISVHALPQAEFDAWLKQQGQASQSIVNGNVVPTTAPVPTAPNATPAAQDVASTDTLAKGKQVFLNNTCVTCHAISGTAANYANVGPNLSHIGSREVLGAGALDAPQDDQKTAIENMAKWVRNPNDFKPGVHMPAYVQLSDADLNNLAAYLESLK